MAAPMFSLATTCEGCVFTVGNQCFLDKPQPAKDRPCTWKSVGWNGGAAVVEPVSTGPRKN